MAVCQGHTYSGGPGEDTVSYGRSNASMHVELGGTGAPPGCGTPDHVLGDNEDLEGSDGPDVLIGDNGQHDEQIYSRFARDHGDRVAAIAIRQLSVGESVLAGGHSETGDHSASTVPWIYSPDGAGISKGLADLKIV